MRVLSEDEEARLMSLLKDSKARWAYPFIVTMLSAGLRPNEACSLRKANVDLERGILLPTDAKSKRDARLKQGVPLNSEVIEVLRVWMKETFLVPHHFSPGRERAARPEARGNEAASA